MDFLPGHLFPHCPILICTVQVMCECCSSWEWGGAVVQAGARLRLAGDGSLLLYNVSQADSGDWVCRAGGRTATTTLTVSAVQSEQPRPAPSFSAHTGREEGRETEQTQRAGRQYDTDLSYDVQG